MFAIMSSRISTTQTGVVTKTIRNTSAIKELKAELESTPEVRIIWKNVILIVILHLFAAYGMYLWLSGERILWNFFWGYVHSTLSGMGVTAGAHRLWAHRAYKATYKLQVLLVILQAAAAQNSLYVWVRDHRMHHKFTETNADPHNVKRGLFFAHIGWVLCKKHPAVKEKGKTVDMSDLANDPLIMFQHRYYTPMSLFLCFGVPTLFFHYILGHTWAYSFFAPGVMRYTLSLHFTWLVNSAAHWHGHRPYDRSIYASENKLVAVLAYGEGWHNYHHVFPWDYKTSELGFYRFNFTTAFIDFCAKIGWAYDLKTASSDMIKRRVEKAGDGSHKGVWGWEDKDMLQDDIKSTVIE